jgi:hypothetical protein
MPVSVFGIPTFYFLVGYALLMAWSVLFGKHNRVLAGLSLLGFLTVMSVIYYFRSAGIPMADNPALMMTGFIGFLVFTFGGMIWAFLDFLPTIKRLFTWPERGRS